MDQYNFQIEQVRFHLFQENVLMFRGWFREDNPQNRQMLFEMDGKPLAYKEQIEEGLMIRQKYLNYQADINQEIIYTVELPENWKSGKTLKVSTVFSGKKALVEAISVAKLEKRRNNLEYHVDNSKVENGQIQLSGWAISDMPVQISVKAENRLITEAEVGVSFRKDVLDVFAEAPKDYQAGFTVRFAVPKENGISLVFQTETKKTVYRTSVRTLQKQKKNVIDWAKLTVLYLQTRGLRPTVKKITAKMFHISESTSYEKWLEKYQITEEELAKQRETVFDYQPKFSIVVPLYRTNETYLREMIESVTEQTYTNWELCLADGSGKEASLEPIISKYQKKYPNIKYRLLTDNKGISENTNQALEMAAGDYIVFADHDDTLALHALYECALALNENKNLDILYSDEDKVDMKGKKYFEPHFKSDFNIDLLCSVNYICHLFIVRRTLQQQVGMMRSAYDGAQDYDFVLRCCEATDNIYHIPKVLYHWRSHLDSTAANPESKLYAFEAGKRAIEAHYERIGVPASVQHSTFYGMYHTTYHWEEKPLLSIVIPNKDHIEDLRKCINSIQKKSTYRNYEFIIVENNSTQQETFDYYKELEKQENITVLYYDGIFNYSKINNFGVKQAKGDYILLLNNDTEIITPDCLEEMLGYCMRPDVGIVGAKLCYEDDTIQHGGVVIGFGGMAGHTFIGESRYAPGYMGRIMCAQNYSAVTAACLMTKKELYWQVGGLTEEFQVALNDIDFCLKVRETGKLVVYNPYAELYHYESKSRGMEDTPEKVQRFNEEIACFAGRWEKLLREGDPYYNPNLTLDKADFSLKQ